MFSAGYNVQTPESGRNPRKKRKTTVNLEEIHCSVCNIWVLGVSQYETHARGAKHQKKSKEKAGDEVVSLMPFMRLNKTVGSRMYTCTVCDVVLNSSVVALRHIVAARHVENMKGESSETKDPLPSLIPATGETEKMQVSVTAPQTLETEKTQVSVSAPQTRQPGTAMDVTPHPALLECTVCDIKTNSESQLQQHRASAKHKLRADLVSRDPSGTLRRLQCDTCNISVNSVIQLNQHMGSEKHKNNANPVPVPTDQP